IGGFINAFNHHVRNHVHLTNVMAKILKDAGEASSGEEVEDANAIKEAIGILENSSQDLVELMERLSPFKSYRDLHKKERVELSSLIASGLELFFNRKDISDGAVSISEDGSPQYVR